MEDLGSIFESNHMFHPDFNVMVFQEYHFFPTHLHKLFFADFHVVD